jgi:hypothetical protein
MANQPSNLHDVFDEIINSGPSTATATAPAATSKKPAVAKMPAAAPVSTKLTAPGTAPVGPRNAGAHACEAGRADNTHMLTNNRRTSLRGSFLTQAVLTEVGQEADTADQLRISDLVLTGVRFLSPVPLRPGTVRQLRTTGADEAKLSSAIRVVSTRVRSDGQFDVTAEFY